MLLQFFCFVFPFGFHLSDQFVDRNVGDCSPFHAKMYFIGKDGFRNRCGIVDQIFCFRNGRLYSAASHFDLSQVLLEPGFFGLQFELLSMMVV